MHQTLRYAACVLGFWGANRVAAGEPEVQVVIADLEQPSALALRPETDELFVAQCGAGRVVRLSGTQPVEVLNGFQRSAFGSGPKLDVRPLSLCFLDKNTLLVGGRTPDGGELARIYDLAQPGELPLKPDAAKIVVEPANPEEAKGLDPVLAAVATKEAVFLACRNTAGQGWFSRWLREGQKVPAFARFLPAPSAPLLDPAGALIVSPQGYLVAAQASATDQPKANRLTFYQPKSRKQLLSLRTGLADVTGLAYSEKTGQLYATDLSWQAPEEGGLFQLIAQAPGSASPVQAKRVARLAHPTALAFAADGSLYVTVLGPQAQHGQVLKIAPGL